MPFIFSHAILGERVREKLPPDTRAFINAHAQAFLLGCQGPDPFLYNHLLTLPIRRAERQPSARLHNTRVEEVMREMLSYACAHPVCAAYFLGYLCHYALDCAAHPYVRCRTNRTGHTRFEAGIDSRLLNQMGTSIRETPPMPLLEVNDDALGEIDGMYARVFPCVYGVHAAGLFKRSCRRMQRWTRRLYDPKGKKRRALLRLETLLGKPHILSGMLFTAEPTDGIDYLNRSRSPWSPPWKPEEAHLETYEELFWQAENEARELCTAAWEAVKAGELAPALKRIGARSFSTGLPWREEAPLMRTENIFEEQNK